MIFVGIDPGLTGAVGSIIVSPNCESVSVRDTPTAEVKKGRKKRNVYLPREMADMLRAGTSPSEAPMTQRDIDNVMDDLRHDKEQPPVPNSGAGLKAFVTSGNGVAVCYLERQQAMPKQGVSSTFSIGYGFGLWEGILAALGIRYEIIGPQVWQKEMLGSVRGKDAARVRAQRLFPELTEQLAPKTKHGRSDALLIAEFARRTYGDG